MLITICFVFMMFAVSLVEFAIAKRRMRQTHNAHLANFDMASLRVTAIVTTQQGDLKFSSRKRPLIWRCDRSKINVFKSLRLVSQIKIVFHCFGSGASDARKEI